MPRLMPVQPALFSYYSAFSLHSPDEAAIFSAFGAILG
jgi:hypothetical protein